MRASTRSRPACGPTRTSEWTGFGSVFPEQFAPAGELDASPFLAGTLVRCLRQREGLTVDGSVAPRLLGQVDEIAAVLQSFYPGGIRGRIPVVAGSHAPSPAMS